MEREALKILIAFDGSELALEAVKYVAAMMPVKHTEVVLFHVETKMADSFWKVEQHMDFRFKAPNIRACITEQHKRLNAALDKAQQILIKEGFSESAIHKKIQARKLGVVNDIVRESHEGYHAVVLGRCGESKIKDMLLGNVPMRLLKKLQGLPMIIVGGACRFHRIMVAFDG
ncbi:MAG: universal stress protein, partial [Desulfatitalea sp.]|nr:universal stress protein [Desulfatitalea sp.]NNJ98949.1 universal stress protein [Desulfatitalea sp.]